MENHEEPKIKSRKEKIWKPDLFAKTQPEVRTVVIHPYADTAQSPNL
jgi:hypothetical protein